MKFLKENLLMDEATQKERILRVIEECETIDAAMTEKKRRAYDDIKIVDLFNQAVSGAIAKLNTLNKFYSSVANMPRDTPEDHMKELASILEKNTWDEMKDISTCMLVIVACETDATAATRRQRELEQEEKEAC